MIGATMTVLTLVADGFINALAGKITDAAAAKLRGEPARIAFQQALSNAIRCYATTGSRLDIAAPLLQPTGPLSQLAVTEELAKVVSFDDEPNLKLIGDRWRASLESPSQWRDFTEQAQLLVNCLKAELRSTEFFRPVFDSRSLDVIASSTATSAVSLTAVAAQLDNLARLFDAHFTQLTRAFSASSVGIRDQIRDYSRYIGEKTSGFVGRQFVFDAIEKFSVESPRGYFTIRGDPGIGKTALIAELVRTQGHVHHFNIRAEGINRTEQFLRNICAQLIARYGLEYTTLLPGATQDAGFMSRLFGEVSDKLDTGERAIIAIDALDEVDSLGLPTGANTLFLPITLPRGIYIVTTTRRVPLSLRIECEQRTLDIEQDAASNIADVRQYVEQAISRPGIQYFITTQGIDNAHFIELLAAKSQGNFMYLRYVLPEIERGIYKDQRLDILPEGLKNYYEDHWRRIRGQDEEAWFKYKLPVVMALTVVAEPVPMELIADFSGVKERSRIRAVLQEWQQFLHEERVEHEGEIQKRYRIYHTSFHDFIASKEEIAEERVSRKEANEKIAKALWSDLFSAE